MLSMPCFIHFSHCVACARLFSILSTSIIITTYTRGGFPFSAGVHVTSSFDMVSSKIATLAQFFPAEEG